MRKIFKTLLLALLLIGTINAQGLCPYIGPDLQLPCGTNNTTLTADFTNCPPGGPSPLATTSYGLTNIPFAPIAPGGTTIPCAAFGNCDDGTAGPYPIGFSFCFFGNTYNQFYLGTNGWLSFSPGQSASWNCAQNPIPTVNPCVPKNCIMNPYFDWFPSGGGIIQYQTIGVAPCRKLVLSYTNVQQFSCWAQLGTFQVILYESTNVIEQHITTKMNCAGWNNGGGVQGIHNLAGTVAVTVPGRNGGAWATNNNSYRYTPSGAPVAPTYNWYQVGNPVSIGTGLTINVTPPAGGASYTCHVDYGACYNGYMTCMGFVGANGPDTITVIPGPPNIFPTIPGPYSFCPGDSLTVGADQLYAQYLWSNGDTTSTIVINTSGPISVNVVDINGCVGTANAVFNVYNGPNININPINPSICPGDSVQLTLNGSLNYTWNPTTNLNPTTGSVVMASPLSNTLYTIIGTDVNGCSDTITNNVFLYIPPVVSVVSAQPSVCPQESVQLTANGANNYVWSPATGLNFTNIINPIATINTQQQWQIIGTDNNGCSDTTLFTLLVDPQPQVNFNAPITSGCAPLTVNLQSNVIIPSGTIQTYQWDISNGMTSNLQNPTFVITTPGTFDVQLIAYSNQGCSDTLIIPNYIQVYSVPVASFFATPQTTTLIDALVNFTNTSTTDVVSCFWTFDNLGTSNNCNPDFQFTIIDTFTVTLYVTTANGCTDTTSGTIIIQDLTYLFIPNTFTPDGDGLNDTWFPIGANLNSSSIKINVNIFNRWGEHIYTSDSPSKPWTGYANNNVPIQNGVYVYKVDFVDQKNRNFSYTGQVTLLR